jgi:hypothetical protein
MRYAPVFACEGENCLAAAPTQDDAIIRASFAIAFVENLRPQEYYCLGAARTALTPTITLTGNRDYRYDPDIPTEYQPRLVAADSADSIGEVIKQEVAILEEDYLDLKDQEKVQRYTEALLETGDPADYTAARRGAIFNFVKSTIDMSQNKTQFRDNFGIINIGSRLDRVSQVLNTSPNLKPEHANELSELVQKLKTELEKVESSRADDANRVAETLELAVNETTKPKPSSSFLKITGEGLKEAANALADIAPTVIGIAAKIAQLLTIGT